MRTNRITDYLQSINDIIPAIQLGLFPDQTIGQVYHSLAETNQAGTSPTILSNNTNQNPFNVNGESLYLVSDSETDTQIIYIEGILHSSGSIAAETKNLNGTTQVPLTNIYKTILRAYNANGVELSADAYIRSTNNIYAVISSTYNDKKVDATLHGIFTVPLNYTAYIVNWTTSAPKGRDVELIAYYRTPGSIFRYSETLSVYQSTVQKTLPWMKFEEKTDLKVEVISSTSIANVTFDTVLLRNDFIDKFKPLAFR